MSRKRATPKQFSAYVVTASDIETIPVDSILIDKGALVVRDWNVIDFETGVETAAVGERLARLCPECRVTHGKVGILGHDGECGSDAVKEEARQELAHAKKLATAPTPAADESGVGA